jgi:flavin reductase (DIM6/NTAB) family NADH-FMN oxidoreductase RutF
MSKIIWKPGTMLYPVPAVLVTSRFENIDNIITISWVGTICSDPPMVSISIRPERYSYNLIKKSGVFAINIPDSSMVEKVDYCGVKSGREVDKFINMKIDKYQGKEIDCPIIKESPVSLECVVKQISQLGSHDMFISEIVSVHVERNLIDRSGRLCLDKANLLCYNHGKYCIAMKHLGKFGFSVEKRRKK